MKYTAFGSGLSPVTLHASATALETLSACLGGVLASNAWPRYVELAVTWPLLPAYSVESPAMPLPPQPAKKLSRPVTMSPGFDQSPQKIASVLFDVSTVPLCHVMSTELPLELGATSRALSTCGSGAPR